MKRPEQSPECAWVGEALFELSDAAPDAPAAERLRRHLESCADCRAARDWDERMKVTLTGARVPLTPAHLPARVRGLLRRKRLARRGILAALAASVLIAAGLILANLQGRTAGQVTPPSPPAQAAFTLPADVQEGLSRAALPPVDPLLVISRESQACVAALEEEF
jgi:hypothetical protein